MPDGRRTWRRCMALSCVGVCHWDGTAWVCETCGQRRVGDGQWAPPVENQPPA